MVVGTDDLVEEAKRIAKRYRRKCWYADVGELAQEGLRAMLRSMHNLNDDESPWPYLRRTAAVAMRNLLLRATSPASAGGRELKELEHANIRVPIDKLSADTVIVVPSVNGVDVAVTIKAIATLVPTDEVLEEMDWTARVRKRLDAVFASVQYGELARAVMLDDEVPRALAEARHIDVRLVYRAVRTATRMIANDAQLYELTLERTR